jgi:hypothetical protein
MKMRTLTTAAVLCCLSAIALAAPDPHIGTWKMNVSKSKFSPGPAPKAVTSVYTEEGGWIVIKTDATDSAGQAVNRTNRYRVDGKEYPYEGPQGKGTISLKRIDDQTTEGVVKFDGGHSVTTRAVISKDGRTRTTTARGTNAKGEKINNVTIWERQ